MRRLLAVALRDLGQETVVATKETPAVEVRPGAAREYSSEPESHGSRSLNDASTAPGAATGLVAGRRQTVDTV